MSNIHPYTCLTETSSFKLKKAKGHLVNYREFRHPNPQADTHTIYFFGFLFVLFTEMNSDSKNNNKI